MLAIKLIQLKKQKNQKNYIEKCVQNEQSMCDNIQKAFIVIFLFFKCNILELQQKKNKKHYVFLRREVIINIIITIIIKREIKNTKNKKEKENKIKKLQTKHTNKLL